MKSETGGKKIRRGDSISTNRYYYAVVKNDFLYHSKISQTAIGKVIINKKEFTLELVPFTTLIGRNWTLHIKTDNYPIGSLPVGTFEQIDKVVELLNEE